MDRRIACLVLLCACGGTTPTPPAEPRTLTVTVNADGSFTPAELDIYDGDTVEWVLHDRTDAVIAGESCAAPAPHDPAGLTGPNARAASGLFVLGPDGPGVVSDPACPDDQTVASVGTQRLCKTGELYAVMDSTLASPAIAGSFIRLRWNDVHLGPDQFDFTVLDREMARAVAHGKLFTIAFKAGSAGTPRWIFDAAITGPDAVVPRLEFRDAGSNPECMSPPCCGAAMELGSPANANYRAHYFALLEAVAAHIQSRADWMRALAYVKPSGANLFTHENRLPDSCDCDCDLCNPEVWATEGEYTPEALYEFYQQQEALLASIFPGKSMVYALIQAGFPRVRSQSVYLSCPVDPAADLPRGTEQTETIIAQGQAAHGLDFVVMHNGLGIGSPNPWVIDAGNAGSITAFQTRNPGDLSTPALLDAALANLVDNSHAIFLEAYEQILWQTENDPTPLPSGNTLASWAEILHARRRTDWEPKGLPDPYPLVHQHTFVGAGDFPYFHGSRCTTGVIRVAAR